jgi:hypothetical protein
LLDLYAWWRREDLARAATGLLVAGAVIGALEALAGVVAFYSVPSSHTEGAHRFVLRHIGLAVTIFVLFTVVAIVRRRRQPAPPSPVIRAIGLDRRGALGRGGTGCRIVYRGGMGIGPKILASHLRENAHEGGQTHGAGGPSRHEVHEH